MPSKSTDGARVTGGGTGGAERPGKDGVYLWGLTLDQAIFLTFLGALIGFYKGFGRLNLHVPGSSGLVWIAVMVVGRTVVPRRLAGTWLGTVAGALAVFLGEGREGPLVFLKYFLPGVTLDLLFLTPWGRRDPVPLAVAGGLFGALAHLTKLLASYIAGRIIGVPQFFLTLGLLPSAVSHAVFGCLGGYLGVVIGSRFPPRQIHRGNT